MSATLRDRPVLPGPAGGGVPARRAVARWAWRLFRREWRQQILVLALLTLTVAAAAFSVSAAYNVASLPGPQFGSASYLLQFGGTSPKTLAADIAAARKAFGTIQVIGRRFVPIPGSAQTVEFRAQNPHGPYGGPMIAQTQGHYPAATGQAAVTGQLAQTLQLRIGSPLPLGGHHQTVTGIVENPSDLNDQFVLVTPPGVPVSGGVDHLRVERIGLDRVGCRKFLIARPFDGQLVSEPFAKLGLQPAAVGECEFMHHQERLVADCQDVRVKRSSVNADRMLLRKEGGVRSEPVKAGECFAGFERLPRRMLRRNRHGRVVCPAPSEHMCHSARRCEARVVGRALIRELSASRQRIVHFESFPVREDQSKARAWWSMPRWHGETWIEGSRV